MTNEISRYVQELEFNEPISSSAFSKVQWALNCKFPSGYLDFMKEKNGGMGTILDGKYVDLWAFESIESNNKDCEVEIDTPQLLFIGSDGGGMAFAIKRTEGTFISLDWLDTKGEYWIDAGSTFHEFLIYLSKPYEGPEDEDDE
jgi:hypothetical protein